MKAATVVLGLLTLLFGFLFFQKSAALTAAEARLATNDLAQTNLYKQFQTELMLTNLAAADVRSNLQHALDVRSSHLNLFSNRLVQINLLLQSAREETAAAQTSLQSLAASNAVLVLRQEDLVRQLHATGRFEAQLADARRAAAVTATERESIARELQAARLAYAELSRELEDPAFLQRQMERVEIAADLRKRAASRPIDPADRRLPLAWQPDGTVRAVTPPRP